MRRIGFAVILLVSLSAPAWADFEEGFAAFERADYATAIREFLSLAEQGHAKAQFHLGFMYHQGQGVPQDDAEAVKWYRLAADQGFADAQWFLGMMYTDGQGVPQDYVRGYMWINLAVAGFPSGPHPPDHRRHEASIALHFVADEMTPAQIAEAQRLAREWRPKSE